MVIAIAFASVAVLLVTAVAAIALTPRAPTMAATPP
jgi:hypothetical protein